MEEEERDDGIRTRGDLVKRKRKEKEEQRAIAAPSLAVDDHHHNNNDTHPLISHELGVQDAAAQRQQLPAALLAARAGHPLRAHVDQ